MAWLTGTSRACEALCTWVAWGTAIQVRRARARAALMDSARELGIGDTYEQLMELWGERA